MLKSPYYSKELQLIGRPLVRASQAFSLKNATGLLSCERIMPIPTTDASHSTWNTFSKLGNAKTEVVLNFSLIKAKLCSTSFPHENLPFFRHSVIGVLCYWNLEQTSDRRLLAHGSFVHHLLSLGLAILWLHGPCPHQHESYPHWPHTLRTITYQSRSCTSSSWYTTHWPATPLILLAHDYSELLLSYCKSGYRQNKLQQTFQ